MRISFFLLVVAMFAGGFSSCSRKSKIDILTEEIRQLEEKAACREEPVIALVVSERRTDLLVLLLNPEFRNSRGVSIVNMTDLTDRWGKTPLHLAAEKGYVEGMEILLAAGARMDVSDVLGNLVVHSAAEGGHVDAMRLLLENGGKIDEKTVENRNPRDPSNDPMVRRALRRSGIDPVDGSHPIHVAARCGNVAMVKFLLSQGADPDSKDNNGQTILDYAKGSDPLVDRGESERGNRLGVVRLFFPDQPAEPPREPITVEELQERFFKNR